MKKPLKIISSILFPILILAIVFTGVLFMSIADWSNPKDVLNTFKKFEYVVNDDQTITITELNTDVYQSFTIPIKYDNKKVSAINAEEINYRDDIKINVEKNHPYFTFENGAIYNKDKTVLILAPFEELDTFTVASSVKTIGKYAFSSAKIDKIILNDGLKKIDDYAFFDCNSTYNINLPTSIEEIGDDAFCSCSGMKKTILSDNIKYGDEPFSSSDTTEIDVSNYSKENVYDILSDFFSLKKITVNENFILQNVIESHFNFHTGSLRPVCFYVNTTKDNSKFFDGLKDCTVQFESDKKALIINSIGEPECYVIFLK